MGLDRSDVVIALGGGVVGDLAGFAASSFMRGIRWVQVPTTVLSIVDSSVGGKTGINHGGAKNLIGAFHQPIGVVVGPQMLKTLSSREVSSGLAEVVKYGVLEGGELLASLEHDAQGLVDSPHSHGELYAQCCGVKARIVVADEREQGVRALLNLGHTFGHAIEAMDGYETVTHGEAVALGMILADRASQVLGISLGGLGPRLAALLPRLGLPVDPSPWISRPESMAELMRADKKSRGQQLDLILPTRPGEVVRHRLDKVQLPWLLREIAHRPQRDYSIHM